MARDRSFHELVKENFKTLSTQTQEADDFTLAAKYLEEAYIKADISEWKPEQFVNLIKETHRLAAKTVLDSNHASPAGTFRKDPIFVMRTSFQLIANFNPMAVLAICTFLSQQNVQAESIKNFMIAFHKYFFMQIRSPSVQLREPNHRKNIIAAAKMKFYLDINDKDFSSEEFLPSEALAFNIVYKIFIDAELIPEELLKLATKTLNEFKLNQNIIKTSTEFLLRCIAIHPYHNVNGRVSRLIFNASLDKFGYKVINLASTKMCTIYYHDFEDPNLEKVYNQFRQIIQPETGKQKSPTSFHLATIAANTGNKEIDSIFCSINKLFTNPQTNKKFIPFFNAMSDKQYARALRMLCIRKESEAFSAIKILVSNKELLQFDINEQAGEKRYSALHQAAIHDNRLIFDYLLEQNASRDLELPLEVKSHLPENYFPKEIVESAASHCFT
ncbi:MAG: Fic family protein [Tatlockia sp.]|nr:Fic family protein [Tatlockia sp.]